MVCFSLFLEVCCFSARTGHVYNNVALACSSQVFTKAGTVTDGPTQSHRERL